MSTAHQTTGGDLPTGLTVDQFIEWATTQPGRYELFCGTVYEMAAERARHAEVKFAVQSELKRAIKAAGRECHMLPDGMTVPVDEHTAHEPDALVYCGNKVPGSTLKIKNPVIVVEVLSPTTRHIDASAKLSGYFQLPSVHHYLIVDPEDRPTIHHQRGTDGKIATTIVPSGCILLDPPGIEVDVAAFFA